MKARSEITRMKIGDLNENLTCQLCAGYLIDATTLVVCQEPHSFCRSCILRYFDDEDNGTCPICKAEIKKTQIQKEIRADHLLQDLVYKLVPGLYKRELKRRREFYTKYSESEKADPPDTTGKQKKSGSPADGLDRKVSRHGTAPIFDRHLVELATFICTPDEIVSLSVEYAPSTQAHGPKGASDQKTSDGQGKGMIDDGAKKMTEETNGGKEDDGAKMPAPLTKKKCGKKSQKLDKPLKEIDDKTSVKKPKVTNSKKKKKGQEPDRNFENLTFKRYFRCPAAVTVGHLKKLLHYKLELPSNYQIEMLHSDEPLHSDLTLVDVAYIYCWRRKAPMQLYFNICKFEMDESMDIMPQLTRETSSPSKLSAEMSPGASNNPLSPVQQNQEISSKSAEAVQSMDQKPHIVPENPATSNIAQISTETKPSDSEIISETKLPGNLETKPPLESVKLAETSTPIAKQEECSTPSTIEQILSRTDSVIAAVLKEARTSPFLTQPMVHVPMPKKSEKEHGSKKSSNSGNQDSGKQKVRKSQKSSEKSKSSAAEKSTSVQKLTDNKLPHSQLCQLLSSKTAVPVIPRNFGAQSHPIPTLMNLPSTQTASASSKSPCSDSAVQSVSSNPSFPPTSSSIGVVTQCGLPQSAAGLFHGQNDGQSVVTLAGTVAAGILAQAEASRKKRRKPASPLKKPKKMPTGQEAAKIQNGGISEYSSPGMLGAACAKAHASSCLTSPPSAKKPKTDTNAYTNLHLALPSKPPKQQKCHNLSQQLVTTTTTHISATSQALTAASSPIVQRIISGASCTSRNELITPALSSKSHMSLLSPPFLPSATGTLTHTVKSPVLVSAEPQGGTQTASVNSIALASCGTTALGTPNIATEVNAAPGSILASGSPSTPMFTAAPAAISQKPVSVPPSAPTPSVVYGMSASLPPAPLLAPGQKAVALSLPQSAASAPPIIRPTGVGLPVGLSGVAGLSSIFPATSAVSTASSSGIPNGAQILNGNFAILTSGGAAGGRQNVAENGNGNCNSSTRTLGVLVFGEAPVQVLKGSTRLCI